MENEISKVEDGSPNADWSQVRCPDCKKMAAEARRGSALRVKCRRCRRVFEDQLL
jgi:ribosomal protein S27E